jgi:hypothetical protein
MFMRVVGGHQEVREAYRHSETGKPTNRRVVRWPVGRTLVEELRLNRMAIGKQLELSEGLVGERARMAMLRYARLLLRNVALNRARLEFDKSEWLEEPRAGFEKKLQFKKEHAQSLLQDPFGMGEPASLATAHFTDRDMSLLIKALINATG